MLYLQLKMHLPYFNSETKLPYFVFIIKYSMKNFFLLIISILFASAGNAQTDSTKNKRDKALFLNVGGSINFAFGDLGKRFPYFANIPLSLQFRNAKKVFFGAEYRVFLGNTVKEPNLFGGILGPSGIIIDINGNPSLISYNMKGFLAQALAGKDWGEFGKKKRSHITTQLGVGFFQHRIKMTFASNLIPQLEGDYRKGYDRLCNGYSFSQSIFYKYIFPEGFSWYAGLDFVQGFTQSRRSWDYSINKKNNLNRKDLFGGIHAGISIPLYYYSKKSAEEFIE